MAPLPDDTFTGPRQAARTARHAAHRARMRAHQDHAPWFFGFLMIGLGLVFLLDNLDVISARFVFRNLWPLLVLAFGLSRLAFGHGGERVFGAIAAAFGGLWLAERLFDWDINVIGVFWPLILIGLGINVLFRHTGRWGVPPLPPIPPIPSVSGVPPGAPFSGSSSSEGAADHTTIGQDEVHTGAGAQRTNASATLREVAILAGIERKNVSRVFRGGTITSVMGSVELDLRECRIADDSARISLQVALGQVVLRIPREWVIDSRVGAVLANLEDRSDPPVSTTATRLILDGSLFMGQVEIVN